ncbi:MAG: thiamine phosphate synthase [Hyphomonadaceae bacterium]|nr:thiamine phosphate synthase [Hyphomonadaceae bacterium]
MSDHQRGFDLAQQMQDWPDARAFIERTFGYPTTLLQHSRHRLNLATVLPKQARSAQLNGVHWSQKHLHRRRQSQMSGLIETCSARRGLHIARAQNLGLDGVLVSTAFASNSPTARRPLGPIRLAILAQRFPNIAIFALGGITPQRAKRLISSGIYGVALVSMTARVV